MGYSAHRGFSNGSMKATGAQRQMEMQQKIAQMQEDMNKKQAEIEAKEFIASVGGGVVEAKVNGKKEVVAINIKPEALRQAGEAMDKGMEQVTGSLNLGAFGL